MELQIYLHFSVLCFSFWYSLPLYHVIHPLGQSRASLKKVYAMQPIREEQLSQVSVKSCPTRNPSMDTPVSSRPNSTTGGLTAWLHEREITVFVWWGDIIWAPAKWRCLKTMLGKTQAARLSLLWTAWATARGSRTDSPREVGGRGDRAGKTGRTQTARPLGKEARSPTAAVPSRSRTSSHSASWPMCGSARGRSPSTRRSRLCARSSPRCPRTSSAKYRPWSWRPDTSTSSTRYCRATSWTPRWQAAAMWRTRGWATPSRCGGWREPGPCQHLTSISGEEEKWNVAPDGTLEFSHSKCMSLT